MKTDSMGNDCCICQLKLWKMIKHLTKNILYKSAFWFIISSSWKFEKNYTICNQKENVHFIDQNASQASVSKKEKGNKMK